MIKNTIAGLKQDFNILKEKTAVVKAKAENKVLNWCIKKMQKDIITASVKMANNSKYLSK